MLVNSKAKLVGNKAEGFGNFAIIAVVAVVLVLAGGGLLVYQRLNERALTKPAVNNFEDCVKAGYPIAESYPRRCIISGQNGKSFVEGAVECPADAKVCSGGSTVSRTGPKCEFASCPGEIGTPTPAPSGVEGWKTYRNEQYGFEVRYSTEWSVLECKRFINVTPASYANCDEKDDDPGFIVSVSVYNTVQIANDKKSRIVQALTLKSKNLEQSEMKLGGEPVVRLITNAEFPSVAAGTKSIWWVVSHSVRVYVISYLASPRNKQETIDRILSTFKFIK